MVSRIAIVAAAATAIAGCGKFQDPNIVIDLRVLAMTGQPPTQLVDVDLSQPLDPIALLMQLKPTQVCALVADPDFDRQLLWSMTVCPTTTDDRCADGDPQYVAGQGLLADPDLTIPEPAMCATVNVDVKLAGVLANVYENDSLHGLGGIDYAVQLRVGGETADRTLDQYATKTVEIVPNIPATATANTNPSIDHIDASIAGATAVPLPLGRCVDNPEPLAIPAGVKVRLTPVEPPGAREVYTVPTLDGGSETFTESLTYQWVATEGSISKGSTGGPLQLTGQPPPLFTDYTAPPATDLMGPTDVSLWIIQRDERLGAHWYEACLRVTP